MYSLGVFLYFCLSGFFPRTFGDGQLLLSESTWDNVSESVSIMVKSLLRSDPKQVLLCWVGE
jgi:hypothetical protein